MIQKEIIILVTGVGAIIGQGIIKNLRSLKRKIKIIGVDRNNASYGNIISDEFITQPFFNSEKEQELFWKKIILEKRINLIIPGIIQDLTFLNKIRNSVIFNDLSLILNRSELIELSNDKWAMMNEISNLDINIIPTIKDGSWKDIKDYLGDYPFIIKPRNGYGSKNIYSFISENEYNFYKEKLKDNYIIQKFVGNHIYEYTVGLFGYGDGTSNLPIMLKRKLLNSGITQWAEFYNSEKLLLIVEKLNKKFLPLGPTNYQFREEDGEFYFLEVNPRISSSTSIRNHFGYNESEMCINYFYDNAKLKEYKYKEGKVVRFIEDYKI